MACEPEQQPVETCNCELALYEDSAPAGCFVYRDNIELNCETGQPIILIPNSTFKKCLDE